MEATCPETVSCADILAIAAEVGSVLVSFNSKQSLSNSKKKKLYKIV